MSEKVNQNCPNLQGIEYVHHSFVEFLYKQMKKFSPFSCGVEAREQLSLGSSVAEKSWVQSLLGSHVPITPDVCDLLLFGLGEH